MSIFKGKILAAVAGLVFAGSAHANLIVNGSFEDNQVANGGWSYFSAASVNGWEGSNIEIWHNMGVTAPDGAQIAELNAHPYTGNIFSIYQNFATVVGQLYDVSFFYRARSSANESFNFSVGSISTLVNDHVTNKWNTYSNSFVATSAITELRFTSVDASTVGNLLDGVVVKSHVPESSSMALFVAGLFGLFVARRKINA